MVTDLSDSGTDPEDSNDAAAGATLVGLGLNKLRRTVEVEGTPEVLGQVRKVALTEAGAQLFPVLRDGFDAFEGRHGPPSQS